MRGGRRLYFSDFSCSFVVVFLFPIPFVFFVLYCIASFLSLLFSCIVLSVFLSIVYNNNNNNNNNNNKIIIIVYTRKKKKKKENNNNNNNNNLGNFMMW